MSDQSIDQLRAEAAERRQAIATDLELMGDRVSPARIAERRKARLRERVGGVRNTLFGASDRERGTYADPYGAPYGSGYGSAGTTYPTTTYSGDDEDSGASMKDRASGVLQSAKQATPDSLGEATQGNPLGVAVVGFGVGLLAASLLPSSPDEQRLARRIQGPLEQGAAELGRTGKEAVEHVKPEAQQAVQDLKDSAKEHADTVKSDAQTKVEDVKGTAQDKTQEVRSQG